ncbi:MAG: peptidoglycan-associated lipoprotein Pal [Deltaproteobacteria bacterium]|nr:peptidoglycan-associated lipoprotein Pal [Deltaproteobacteria bacterium]
MFVSGCATDQAVKSETIKSGAIKSNASMNDILAGETAKSKKEIVAMRKAAAARKAAQKKLMAEAAAFEDVKFSFDRYDLNPEARNTLGGVADWLSKQSSWVITIEGHCDNRGTLEYNLALGERRAQTAKDYLTSLGVAAERITTISYGEERPLDPANNEGAWTKNRRDHFLIVPKK